MNTNLQRDFSFEEWESLSFEEKREIWNKYWNPYEPLTGERTRNEILEKFKEKNKKVLEKSVSIGFGYFAHYVGCIYVLVENSDIRIPQRFSDISINKGVIKEKINETEYVVDWRIGGTKSKFKIKSHNKAVERNAEPLRSQHPSH